MYVHMYVWYVYAYIHITTHTKVIQLTLQRADTQWVIILCQLCGYTQGIVLGTGEAAK